MLRSLGYHAIDLRELGISSASDEHIFQRCQEEQRTVITRDLDFGELAVAYPAHPGVVLLRVRELRSAAIIDRLVEVLGALESSTYSGSIVVIERAQVRIRQEPRAEESS